MCDTGLNLEKIVDTYQVAAPGTFSRISPVEAVPPRILFVDNEVSDFLRYRISLASKLRDSGFDVHVALPEEKGVEHIVRQGIPVHMFHIKRTSTQPLDEFRTLVSLLLVYRQVRPILVHQFCLKPSLYGGISARISGVPAV